MNMLDTAVKKPAQNVEIKAKISNWEEMVTRVRNVSKSDGVQLKQRDVFFRVRDGRLKIRKFEDNKGELIYYKRPDAAGPSLCDYRKCELDPKMVTSLVDTLTEALGVTGVVVKTRLLFMVGDTRIHLDDVDGLGHFMELEVVLGPGQTVEQGQQTARMLMTELKIAEEDLLKTAYTDMLHDQFNSVGSFPTASLLTSSAGVSGVTGVSSFYASDFSSNY